MQKVFQKCRVCGVCFREGMVKSRMWAQLLDYQVSKYPPRHQW